MKKKDVVQGGVYTAKVSGQIVEVRIGAELSYGGWSAVNMRTGRVIRIKSAAKLRERIS